MHIKCMRKNAVQAKFLPLLIYADYLIAAMLRYTNAPTRKSSCNVMAEAIIKCSHLNNLVGSVLLRIIE